MTNSPAQLIDIVRAEPSDRPVLERLWTMFRHDMSAFSGVLPDRQGRFRQERLNAALDDAGWAGYVLRLGADPVGLCVIRGLDDSERVINSFFLVHGARRAGHGRTAVRSITREHPGRWAVAFTDANVAAANFWRSVAADADPAWTHEHRPVPGRPDVAPDSWVHFSVAKRED